MVVVTGSNGALLLLLLLLTERWRNVGTGGPQEGGAQGQRGSVRLDTAPAPAPDYACLDDVCIQSRRRPFTPHLLPFLNQTPFLRIPESSFGMLKGLLAFELLPFNIGV